MDEMFNFLTNQKVEKNTNLKIFEVESLFTNLVDNQIQVSLQKLSQTRPVYV